MIRSRQRTRICLDAPVNKAISAKSAESSAPPPAAADFLEEKDAVVTESRSFDPSPEESLFPSVDNIRSPLESLRISSPSSSSARDYPEGISEQDLELEVVERWTGAYSPSESSELDVGSPSKAESGVSETSNETHDDISRLECDLIPITGACVTMKDINGIFQFVSGSGDILRPATDEEAQLRRKWLVEAKRLDMLAEKQMRKKRGYRPILEGDQKKSTASERYIPAAFPVNEEAFFAHVRDAPVGPLIDESLEQTITTKYLGKYNAPPAVAPIAALDDLRFHLVLLKNCRSLGLDELLPIQRTVIPTIRGGYDVTGVSPTGTGKTVSFLVPIIQAISENRKTPVPGEDKPLALILCPTHELATQIQKTAMQLAFGMGINCFALYGSMSTSFMKGKLAQGQDIIVATPGRALDVINQKLLRVHQIKFVVVDEVDRMILGRSFPEVTTVLNSVSFPPADKRQTLFFSATISDSQLPTLTCHQHRPFFVQIGKTGPLASIDHAFEKTRGFEEKVMFLHKHLDQAEKDKQSVIIFASSKFTVDSLAEQLRARRLAVTHGFLVWKQVAVQIMLGTSALLVANRQSHGLSLDVKVEQTADLSQARRDGELTRFTVGDADILLSTDLSARGLDIPQVGLVINFNLPRSVEEYIHRVGRSGRKGHPGSAVSFFDPTRRPEVFMIKYLMDALKDSGIPVEAWLEEESAKHGVDEGRYGERVPTGTERDLADFGMFLSSYPFHPLDDEFRPSYETSLAPLTNGEAVRGRP